MSDRIKRDPNRKSARSFNLDKPEGLSFELEKPESHKFELEKPESHNFELEKPEGHKFELDKSGTEDQQLNAGTQPDSGVDKKTAAAIAAATVAAGAAAVTKSADSEKTTPVDGSVAPDDPEAQPQESATGDLKKEQEASDKGTYQGSKNKKKKKGKDHYERTREVRQEPVQTSQPETPVTPEPEESKGGNGKKWAAAIAALALLGGGGYAVSNFMGSNGDNGVKTEELAQNGTDETIVDENTPEGLVEDASGTIDATDEVAAGTVAGEAPTTPSDESNATEGGMKPEMSSEKPTVASGVSKSQTSVGDQGNVSGNQSSTQGKSQSSGQGQSLSSGHEVSGKTNNPETKQASSQQQSNNASTGASANAAVNSNKTGKSSSSQSYNQQTANSSTTATNNNVQPSVSKTAPAVTGNVEEMAWKVIRGDFGNGLERKRLLGDKYRVIQRRVNQLYRKGRVK